MKGILGLSELDDMPSIDKFGCNKCDFAFPSGWGSYTYATDGEGKRIVCGHPGEERAVLKVTGLSWADAQAAGRVGLASYCACFDCCFQFDLDLDRDIKKCPKCGSLQVKSAYGAIALQCPKCNAGKIVRAWTGVVS